MKRWVTGEKAEMDSEDIERELFELARDWMSQPKLKKLPGHQSKPTETVSRIQGEEWVNSYSIVSMPIAPSMQMQGRYSDYGGPGLDSTGPMRGTS